MSAVIAFGACSSLGRGEAAFAPGPIGESAPSCVRLDEELSSAGLGRPHAARVMLPDDDARDRATQLLSQAFADCARDLDAALPEWRSLRVGAAIGTSSGGMRTFEQGRSWRSPYIDPLIDAARPCAFEPCSLVLGACASSAIAIGIGRSWIESERCDLVLCGGFDAVSVFVAAGFECLRATSSEGGPRPFRRDRDGLALGEGAAIVALASRAQAGRGRRARAWITGFGCTCDAKHLTAPDPTGDGLARAAQAALDDAELAPAAIGLVSAHGTATRQNDEAEAAALGQLLAAPSIPIFALKGTLGHTLGAAGALEVLGAIAAMEKGVAPASAGSGPTEAGLRLLDRTAPSAARTTLKLSSAFGGVNAAVVVSLDPPARPRRSGATEVTISKAVRVTLADADGARLAERTGYGADRIARADDLVRLAIAAVASLEDGAVGSLRGAGIIIGHGLATIATNRRFLERIRRSGAARGEPRRFPYTTPNAAAGECAVAFGLNGPAFAVGGGPHGGLEAIAVAADLVRTAVASRIAVVAVDAPAEGSGGAVALVVGGREQPGAVARLEEWSTRLDPGSTEGRQAEVGAAPVDAHHALLPLVMGPSAGELCLAANAGGVGLGARARIRYLGAGF